MRVGTVLQFVGGGITTAARNAIFFGIFVVVVGMTPGNWLAGLLHDPPAFISGALFQPGLVVIGLAIIAAALWFNIWSRKQICIDEVSEQLAWAVHNLLNKKPKQDDPGDIARWWGEVVGWEAKVDRMLENRAFFTRSDQLHFGVLGFVEPLSWTTGNHDLDHMLRQLRMKFDRLRDVINWAQARRR